MERLRGASSQRREEQHELQIGRLKQDRVHVPRGADVSIYLCVRFFVVFFCLFKAIILTP